MYNGKTRKLEKSIESATAIWYDNVKEKRKEDMKMADQKKTYGNMRIMSFDGSTIYLHLQNYQEV